MIYIAWLMASTDSGFTVQVKKTVNSLFWFRQVSFTIKFRWREQTSNEHKLTTVAICSEVFTRLIVWRFLSYTMTYIEDIICPCVDMNLIFECSTRYLTSERSERVCSFEQMTKTPIRGKNRIYLNNSIRSKKQRNHVGTRPYKCPKQTGNQRKQSLRNN